MNLIDENEDIISQKFEPSKELVEKLLQSCIENPKIRTVERMSLAFSNWVSKITLESGKTLGLKVCVFSNRRHKFHANCIFLNKYKDIGLPLQNPLYCDYSKKDIAFPYLVYDWVDGEVLTNRLQDPNVPLDHISRQLGDLLAKIHNIKSKKINDFGKSRKFSNWGDYIDKEFEDSFDHFDIFGKETKKKAEKFFKNNRKQINSKIQNRMIHKDFKTQNILVNDDNDIVGLIDLENHITGDRLFDFGIINSFIFERIPEMKNKFMEEYQKHHDIPKNFDQIIKFYDFIVYSGHLKRISELKEVKRFWTQEKTFSRLLGEDVKIQNAPAWAV